VKYQDRRALLWKITVAGGPDSDGAVAYATERLYGVGRDRALAIMRRTRAMRPTPAVYGNRYVIEALAVVAAQDPAWTRPHRQEAWLLARYEHLDHPGPDPKPSM